MKKLKLNLDELKVESFEMSSKVHVKNTIEGYDFNTARTSPCDEPCNETEDYGNTCYATCEATCNNTCDHNVFTCVPIAVFC